MLQVAAFVALTVQAGGTAAPTSIMDEVALDDLLDALVRRQEASGGMTARFVETRKLPMLAEPVRSNGRMDFRPPANFRREVDAPTPSITVGNGHELRILFPQFSRMEVYALDGGSPVARPVRAMLSSLDFSRLEEHFRVSGQTSDEGAAVLDLTPKSLEARKSIRRVVLELNTSLELHRSLIELEDGTRIETTCSEVVHGPVKDSRFRLDTPDGVAEVRPLAR